MSSLLKGLSLAAVVGLLCFCGTGPDRPRAVLVVLVDSLRPDHINAYGYRERLTTPELDKFIENGVAFTNAYSNAPWTVPSVMSLMTSLYPSAHGYNLEAHVLRASPPALHPRIKSLPEIFHEAGFLTAAFTANGGVSAAYGFDRFFDRFEETPPVEGSDVETVVAKALAWLEENWQRPFFLFLHTYEVHLPHTHQELQQASSDSSESIRERALRGYDADLRFTDAALAQLWSWLRSKGIFEDSIIVILSDHGEALHERTVLGRGDDHGYHLHDELLKVPLFIVGPGNATSKGVRIDEPVQLVDVLPTLVELAGIDPPSTPRQGISLVPLLRGGRLAARPLFAEAPFQGPGWVAVRFGHFKYVFSPQEHTHEGPEMWWDGARAEPEALYDLRSDPGETRNVFSEEPDELALLRDYAESMRKSSEYISKLIGDDRQPRAIDPAVLKRLKSLGYLQ